MNDPPTDPIDKIVLYFMELKINGHPFSVVPEWYCTRVSISNQSRSKVFKSDQIKINSDCDHDMCVHCTSTSLVGAKARTYLQPHYGNGVFGNVYLSAGGKLTYSLLDEVKSCLHFCKLFSWCCYSAIFHMALPERIYNSHYGNAWRPGIAVSVTQRHCFKPITWYAKSRTTKSIPGLYYRHPIATTSRK